MEKIIKNIKGVKMLDGAVLKELAQRENYEISDIEKAICVSSYEEYKSKGGIRTSFDLYASLKEAGKDSEERYISLIDMASSLIPVTRYEISYHKIRSQAYYLLLNKMFGTPLREVSFTTFDLKEFNQW